jgi:hypothetical protein
VPYTTVVAGTTITASWGNASVRDQVVTPFASAAARTSAITSPVAGMLSYRSDGDIFDGYTGSAWKPATQIRNFGFHNSTADTLSTTSSSYVDLVNASQSWTKIGASGDSDVGVFASVDMYTGATATAATIGININSTDYDVMLHYISASGTVTAHSAFVKITGVAAGAFTAKLRAKRNSGTGTLTIDTLCNTCFVVCELPK